MKTRLLVPLFLTILLIALGAIASACGGGNDSDGATDGNADDRSGEGDGSSSSSSGSSVPLYSSDVYDFKKGAFRGSAGQLEAANRELDRVVESGQKVIMCTYGPTNTEAQTGYPVYGFWYEDLPDNIDELLLAASDYGAPPVSRMGTNANTSCPDSQDEGKALWLEDYPGLSADGGGGAVTLRFENIRTRISGANPCGINTSTICIAAWELDIVFEAPSDVGATITQSQVCHIWNDGKLFGLYAFGTGCRDPFELEYRIDPRGEFRTRVSGDGLAADHGVVYKYTGRDDEGNVIYLERALSTHETISGLEIVDRNEYWLADRPYKEWRSNNEGPADRGTPDLEDREVGSLSDPLTPIDESFEVGSLSDPLTPFDESFVGPFRAGSYLFSVPDEQKAAAEREVLAVVDSGQEILLCSYSYPGGRWAPDVTFWNEEAPANLDALLSLAPRSGSPRQVFVIGRAARSSCPETLGEAKEASEAEGGNPI